ncbi:hypothetical protein MANES_15G188000v8 [Manihot esculenta]|uniref:Uncharacterized protein n=1 Tax=Manihot esculenta TaxID=3983 RepID=A0ACB7GD18_MANES|nr:hypothetical protein MANES_15G188000v8 [Manihot esculenta]
MLQVLYVHVITIRGIQRIMAKILNIILIFLHSFVFLEGVSFPHVNSPCSIQVSGPPSFLSSGKWNALVLAIRRRLIYRPLFRRREA